MKEVPVYEDYIAVCDRVLPYRRMQIGSVLVSSKTNHTHKC